MAVAILRQKRNIRIVGSDRGWWIRRRQEGATCFKQGTMYDYEDLDDFEELENRPAEEENPIYDGNGND